MWKLIVHVAVEVVVGLMVGGVILAVLIPPLLRRHWIEQGDVRGACLISLVLLITVGVMVFRPGGTLRRTGHS